jgi:hypothetical protein
MNEDSITLATANVAVESLRRKAKEHTDSLSFQSVMG